MNVSCFLDLITPFRLSLHGPASLVCFVGHLRWEINLVPSFGGWSLEGQYSRCSKGKSSPTRIGGVLRKHKGEALFMFSKHVGGLMKRGIGYSGSSLYLSSLFPSGANFAERFAQCYSWGNSVASSCWRFQFYFNEIKSLSSSSQADFCHVSMSATSMEDALAK